MKINVRTVIGHGRDYDFNVDYSTTVKQLKQLICEETRNRYDLEKLSLIHLQTRDILDKDNETLEYYDVKDGSQIELHDLTTKARLSNLGLRFLDLDDGTKYEVVQWSSSAPRWRVAGRGLCLEGTCINPKCDAFEQKVVMTIGYRVFDVVTESDEDTTYCPLCKKYVEPVTCAFNNCRWRYEGKKVGGKGNDKTPAKCSSNWQEAGDAYHYFDEKQSEFTVWRQLKIETVKNT